MTKKYSAKDAGYIIYEEGIGYAVKDYTAGKNFADPEIAQKWDEAAEVLNELEALIRKKAKTDDTPSYWE